MVNAVHVSMDEHGGVVLETVIKGDTVREVLDYVEYDVNMLVMLTGKERTHKQFESLLRAAGLGLHKVTPVSQIDSLIEARPL